MRQLDEWIEAGAVLRPHGIRGEVIVDLKVDLLGCFFEGLEVRALTPKGDELRLRLDSAREHKGRLIAGFADVDTREAADDLRGYRLWLTREQVGPLDEDRWFVQDIVGMNVSADDGRSLGTLVEVLNMPANDVYVVRGKLGEILLPAIDDVIRDVDVESGEMVVHLLEGLVRETE